MKYIIGIDGGGTKTLGYISNLEGKILSKALGGPSNYHSVGLERTKQSILKVIKKLLSFVNATFDDLELLVLGLAGIDRDEDKKNILNMLINMGFKNEIILKNDAVTALVGANGKQCGVITISGTGSISFGMNTKGKMIRCGGWGHIIDDEGSGYDIGRRALSEVFKSHDGRIQKTILCEKILNYLNLKTIDQIIDYVYNREVTKDKIAQLAPIVFEAANENDVIALNILNQSIDSLVEITETVIKNLDFDEEVINLTLDGGILRKVKYIQDNFKKKINQKFDNINVSTPLFDGGIGALLIAWNHLNISYSLDNIKIQIKEIN